ncbi:MAG: hypothetical protein HC784_14420 [Hydrococcus sp. CSU_1_8]|nr:hypothetical protein [Hydrococcus sp. CSU_1_8]
MSCSNNLPLFSMGSCVEICAKDDSKVALGSDCECISGLASPIKPAAKKLRSQQQKIFDSTTLKLSPHAMGYFYLAIILG